MSRMNLRVDKQGRQCCECLKYKTWDLFWRDKANKNGHVPVCMKCATARKNASLVPSANGKEKFVNPSNVKPEKDVNLSELLQVRKVSKRQWTYPQALKLFSGIMKEWRGGNTDFPAIYKEYGSDKSIASCSSMHKELRRAAERGMKLAEYWSSGRKFSYWAKQNEIVVPCESKKKK